MKAVLITIGDEVLSGTTMDTNSNFIAAQLRNIGIKVVQIFTVADTVETIEDTLGKALKIADIVITTGGLGPTKDDRTKTAYKNFFEDELHLDDVTFEHLKKLLIKRKREHLLSINHGQAEVLTKAKVFQNEYGTAPCQMLEKDGRLAFCLPGVPYEVKPLIKDKIVPYLKERFHLNSIVVRTVTVVDFPESLLSQTIEAWELALPKNISLSYLHVGNRIKLKFTASGTDESKLRKILEEQITKLRPYIEEKTISWNGSEINEILGEILKHENLTLSVAESCTGGELSHQITLVSGCSNYFSGSIVAYSEQQKTEILGVEGDLMNQFTVVSEEVAKAMSLGCQKLFKTNIAISTTGVAGPESDQYGNTVGTVFYSIRINDFEQSNRLFLPHLERQDFMNFVSQRIIQDLVEILVKKTYVVITKA